MKKRYYAIIFVLLIYNYDWLFLIYDFCFNKPASTLKETVHYKFLERNFTVKSDGSYAVVEKIQGVMKKKVSENFFYEMRYVNNQNDIKILEAKSIVDGEEYIIERKLFLKNKFSSNKTKEDYFAWLKISKKYPIYGINKYLSSVIISIKSKDRILILFNPHILQS